MSSHKSRRVAAHVDLPPRTARQSAFRGLRLRLKPAHRSCGFVQGAWWPRSNQLHTELPPLLTVTVVAGGLRRPGDLRRDQVGASIIAFGVQGPQRDPRGLPATNRPIHCR